VVGGHPQIDPRKCIGCGQCELHCPHGVIALHYQEREVFLPLLRKEEVRIKN
jgi:ferredoxin